MVVCGLQAIHGYRETERLNWTQKNKVIFDRVREHAFPSDAKHMSFIHVLDLAKEGCIKAHIDSIRVSIPLIIIAVIMVITITKLALFTNEIDKGLFEWCS